MATLIMDEVDKTYVDGWEKDGSFTFTEHKALAQGWTDDDAARRAINEAVPLPENAFRLILVPDTLTPREQAVGALMKLKPEERIDVLTDFCTECGEPHSPHCRRDLDLA